jgi:hypothetical protein
LEAKAKAEKEARDKVWQDKLAEDKKNAESGKVYINANTSVVKGIIEPVKKATNVTDTTVMIGTSRSGSAFSPIFMNEKGETLLENKEWVRTYSFGEITLTQTGSIPNIGIVRIGDPYFHWKANTYHFDIVHLKDGWLLISCFDIKDNHLYNMYSQKKIMLESLIDNDVIRFYSGVNTLHYFVPIFSENLTLIGTLNYAQIASWSEDVKKNLSRKFGTQINEELLNACSFIFVHTNHNTNYLYAASNLDFFRTIVLYCMSKNGELTTIKLR